VKAGRFDHINDAELLEKYYNDNNHEWIGVLLERYTLLLFGVCMKYLKNEEEAKDAVQQIFLKVLSEVNKYKIDYFKSWLYMVAKNYCLMKLRGNNGRDIKEISKVQIADEETDKQKFIENEKTYIVLEESLKELNDEQKQCVILFYLKKNSYNQISEITGFSIMQVKSYIQNGKRNLKLLLQKKLDNRH
jgi:RNA polymerase sigma-70 factor (ECF subfamily)